jgi:hypothetical protein
MDLAGAMDRRHDQPARGHGMLSGLVGQPGLALTAWAGPPPHGYGQTAVKSAVTGAAFPALSVTTPW